MEQLRPAISTSKPQATNLFHAKFFKGLHSLLAECKKARLISKTNILLPPQTIAVVLTKNINSPATLGTKDQIANVIENPFLCVESPSLYKTPTVCVFLGKEVNRMLPFIVNLSHDEAILSGSKMIFAGDHTLLERSCFKIQKYG